MNSASGQMLISEYALQESLKLEVFSVLFLKKYSKLICIEEVQLVSRFLQFWVAPGTPALSRQQLLNFSDLDLGQIHCWDAFRSTDRLVLCLPDALYILEFCKYPPSDFSNKF